MMRSVCVCVCVCVHVKYRYSCQILIKLEFSQLSSKNPHILNFMKIRPMEPSYSMRMVGQTDITKLIVAFRNYITFIFNP